MKKKTLMVLALAAMMALSACGASQSESTTSAASEDSAPASAVTEATPEPEETAEPAETSAVAGEEVDVGGPYPATTDWDEYALVEYYFEETDETVPMLIETNADHTRFNTLFDFFGEKQEMTFSVDGEELVVEYDLTGFIGKATEEFYTFIQENVTEWTPISAGAETGSTAGEEVDVGGPYPATTDWDEYVVVDYYFEETDETVPMLIETNADHTRFNTLFDFFGDKQEMSFSVNGDELTVENDLTGFIGKDVEKIYTFIQENVTEWTPIA